MRYPLALIPEPDKKRAHKLEFCRRLIRNIEHFDTHPWVWGVGSFAPLPPLLRLPAELRQKILNDVLDDDEVRYRPNYLTQNLAVVCKTFSTDFIEVSKLWDQREAEQVKGYGMDRASMRSYIAELNGDRERAAAVMKERREALKGRKGREGKKGRKRETRRKVEAEEKEKCVEKEVFKFNNLAMRPKGKITKFE